MKATKTGIALSTVAAWFTEAAYAVSPIDLIPDIIPVLGLVDDFLGLCLVLAFTGYAIYRWRNASEFERDKTKEIPNASVEALVQHAQPAIVQANPVGVDACVSS